MLPMTPHFSLPSAALSLPGPTPSRCHLHLLPWKLFIDNSPKPNVYLRPYGSGASLVVQWLRIRLPMPGTQVPALVWEDPTCRRAKARASQLLSLHSRACEPQLLKPTCLEPVLRNKRSHRNKKPAHRNEQ